MTWEADKSPLELQTARMVEHLIAEAVAKEREGCAQIADSFVGCEAIASKIRARGNE